MIIICIDCTALACLDLHCYHDERCDDREGLCDLRSIALQIPLPSVLYLTDCS